MNDQKKERGKADKTYARFAAFYDAYVGDYAEDIPFYLDLASACPARILEVGCGTGRILLPLLKAGHKLTGVDISPEMLALASEKIQGQGLMKHCLLLHHDFTVGPLPREYGLGLITFYTFNYLLTPEDQRRFLENIAQSLLPGSTLALHLFFPSPLLHPETAGQWVFKGRFRIQGETVLLHDMRRMLDPWIEERIQAFEYPSGQREEIRTLRRWVTPAEIHDLLVSCGFSSPKGITGTTRNDHIPLDPQTPIHKDLIVTAIKHA